ncbi:MarR family transcriptional regulator [Hathewaya histolytica]|uniref:MarR family transcriptional regulator n=1 Tax=Hathewaya histolytica TaxID=1498 RepID=A0A4U9RVZ7_HATHI|nr:MarR family transcriptional regulator [Hathewaya histolytica]VTQ95846.1 MarR family transcriptional regulator [Hathewaya histolytica]
MQCFDKDSLYYSFVDVEKVHYKRIHMLLEEIGLYPGQPHLLLALQLEEGQSQKELADKMKIKPATITVMIKRMEKEGLVERIQDTEDQRISRVYLTEKGKDKCKEVYRITEILEGECFKGFTTEEQILLRRLFINMKDNLIESIKNSSK